MKPRVFALYIGGYEGTSYSVELKGDGLVYTCWSDRTCEKYRIRPSRAAWARFWRSLDEIGFWSWKGSYSTPWVLDGTSWSVDVALGPRSLRTQGSNAYPSSPTLEGDRRRWYETSTAFEKFCEAVGELLGGHHFG